MSGEAAQGLTPEKQVELEVSYDRSGVEVGNGRETGRDEPAVTQGQSAEPVTTVASPIETAVGTLSHIDLPQVPLGGPIVDMEGVAPTDLAPSETPGSDGASQLGKVSPMDWFTRIK